MMKAVYKFLNNTLTEDKYFFVSSTLYFANEACYGHCQTFYSPQSSTNNYNDILVSAGETLTPWKIEPMGRFLTLKHEPGSVFNIKF